MKTSDFDYYLPVALIAQTPVEPRDSSRLLVIERASDRMSERHFSDLSDFLREGDVLVCNNSRVLPARLFGVVNGHKIELLLLGRKGDGSWQALSRPGKRVKTGYTVEILNGRVSSGVTARITGEEDSGIRHLCFSDEAALPGLGVIPLPPYIHQPLERPERYQTIYAERPGSVAAPTAGLHFTPGLLAKLTACGVRQIFVTLHIGLDTFRPVRVEDPWQHPVHTEYGQITGPAATVLSQAKRDGGRIICVGTSSARLVEYVAGINPDGAIGEFSGQVDLLILPGHRFLFMDGLLTNFHLPRSTTLMLTAAFTGWAVLKEAYSLAIAGQYRFYSFGDAMLVL